VGQSVEVAEHRITVTEMDGRRIARPTEHVAVTNCTMYEGHGCIVIGSETSGDIRDVVATNIVGKGTDTGLRIKSQRGRGGVVENVRVSNFVLENVRKQAIEITTLYSRNIPPEPLSVRTPAFRNIAVSNFTIINANQVASIYRKLRIRSQAELGLMLAASADFR